MNTNSECLFSFMTLWISAFIYAAYIHSNYVERDTYSVVILKWNTMFHVKCDYFAVDKKKIFFTHSIFLSKRWNLLSEDVAEQTQSVW